MRATQGTVVLQLISQNFRGWAWTRALLGVPAKEIHVCGDQSAIEVVRSLCKVAGMPEPEVRRFERLTALDIDDDGLLENDYANVQPGDAVIGFSVLELFKIKAQIDAKSPYKAALVYGSLPPMARRQQALSFNTPDSGYEVRSTAWEHAACVYHTASSARAMSCTRIMLDVTVKTMIGMSDLAGPELCQRSAWPRCFASRQARWHLWRAQPHRRRRPVQVLVASDAIGMGVNLNVRRIIFHSMSKYDPDLGARAPLPASLIKQIAGASPCRIGEGPCRRAHAVFGPHGGYVACALAARPHRGRVSAGRAGRKGTQYENGLATTRDPAERYQLRQALAQPTPDDYASTAGLLPTSEQVRPPSLTLGPLSRAARFRPTQLLCAVPPLTWR